MRSNEFGGADMKKIFIKFIVILFLIISVSPVQAWLFYSKPEFRGRVIDAETKQPIEGAVVVALYYKQSVVSLNPAGTSAYVFAAKETLTDGKGEFYIPSFSSWMIFTEDVGVSFIFFKPGYMSCYGPTHINTQLVEKYFSIDVIGKISEIEDGSFEEGNYVKWKGPLGGVELKKTKTREERRKTRPSSGGLEKVKLPIFLKVLEEEYKYLYNER